MKEQRSETFLFLESRHDGGDWYITSEFGQRMHPITGKKGQFHKGIDIGVYSGTKVYAPCNGIITANRLAFDSTQNSARGGGYMVYLERKNGDRVRFLHLLEVSPYVKVGDRVKTGELLCQTGNSGGSTGAHLHIDVQSNGRWIEPVEYLARIGAINLKRLGRSIQTKESE